MRVTRESVNNAKVLYRLSFDRSEVERAQEIYFLSPKLQQVMNNPTIPYEKKADILEKIFSKAGDKYNDLADSLAKKACGV